MMLRTSFSGALRYSLLWSIVLAFQSYLDAQTFVFNAAPSMKIETASFGTVDDQPITRYTMTNADGNRASVMNFGATLLEVEVPDRDGNLANVNLSFDTLDR